MLLATQRQILLNVLQREETAAEVQLSSCSIVLCHPIKKKTTHTHFGRPHSSSGQKNNMYASVVVVVVSIVSQNQLIATHSIFQSKLIDYSRRWCNIFQSGIIYYSRRRPSTVMMSSKGASQHLSANFSLKRDFYVCFLHPPLLGWRLSHVISKSHSLFAQSDSVTPTFPPHSSVKTFLCYII